MSVAGIMLVRDEADIIERVLDHAAAQVDYLMVMDNRSTDGTYEIVKAHPGVDFTLTDAEVGYYQSQKMTRLANSARKRGFKWVVPMDADELWTVAEPWHETETVAERLKRQAPNVQIVSAALYDYLPPSGGIDGSHPLDAITWRRIAPGAFPKVAARTHATLTIHPGNHGADYGNAPALTVPGLMVRHFTWRTPEQYLRKIRNGLEAYGASDVPEMYGTHWRMWEGHDDETILDHYRMWFTVEYPPNDEELVYDPVS
jgi:glycosyltransferase involved in cell wall biosynthesis